MVSPSCFLLPNPEPSGECQERNEAVSFISMNILYKVYGHLDVFIATQHAVLRSVSDDALFPLCVNTVCTLSV